LSVNTNLDNVAAFKSTEQQLEAKLDAIVEDMKLT
jgi:hypothetical protein